MIAMCYIIIYMLNDGYLPGVSETNESDRNKHFLDVRNVKS